MVAAVSDQPVACQLGVCLLQPPLHLQQCPLHCLRYAVNWKLQHVFTSRQLAVAATQLTRHAATGQEVHASGHFTVVW